MEPTFERLAVATLLGLLVGLEREHAASGMAGMRTFPLVTLLGSLAVLLAGHFGESWIVAAGLLGIIGVIVVGHMRRPQPDASGGTTTDVAMLVMYAVGALVMVGPMAVAIVVGASVAVLLQFKIELHAVAKRLGDKDLRAIMQFVLIACIVLPLLPNENYGPASLGIHAPAALNVLNPYWIWVMVVLIVGLSLGGYIVYKFFGEDAGILLGGVLGGAISSTATTVSYARDARGDPMRARTALIVIMIASTVMYVRVLVAVAVVSPAFLGALAPPVLLLMLLTFVPALALWFRVRRHSAPMPEQTNPTQLRSAIVFAMLYAVVLLALAVAKQYWNGRGLYTVAFLSGLTEMDAITLSTARMVSTESLASCAAWRMLVVAAMANLVSKAGIAGLLGGWGLLGRIVLLFTIPLVGGLALLAFWC
ncbi:MAG: MgtC/SapB family protein [Planctomycetaceae bacterium]|nr:MgtC/SapB family protein [Planctomycetaceae bacterium]